jgi:peroxisomal membrane protein 4
VRQGYFAILYKAIVAVLRGAYSAAGRPVPATPGTPAATWHAFVAGALASRAVWSHYSTVNLQIVLYLLSRVLMGSVRLAAKRGVAPFSRFTFAGVYPWLAVAVWGAVMALYELDKGVLHPSLATSMDEIYAVANTGDASAIPALRDRTLWPELGTAAVVAYMLYQARRGGLGAWLAVLAPPSGAAAAGGGAATPATPS